MFLTKHNGVGIPSYPHDKEEWDKVKEGAEVKVTLARNAKFHRKLFALLKLLFENQDKYDNIDIYRQILTIKAGFVTWVTGLDKIEYPFASSWAFDKMSQDDFEKLYKAILEVGAKEIGVEGSQIESELAAFY